MVDPAGGLASLPAARRWWRTGGLRHNRYLPGAAKPEFDKSSVAALACIADGSRFALQGDPLDIYANVNMTAALWMGSMARQHPHIRFVTMSPGGTTGTNGMDDLPFQK